MTYRAVRILREVDGIICEDTRQTGILLKHYDISNRLESFHAHSDERKVEHILRLLADGKNMALVSDAGTPGISDPGYVLIRRAIEAGIPVSPIPGASAVLSGLVCSGLATHHFLYLGFLPIKHGRTKLLDSLVTKTYTVVIYESVHRITRTLGDIEKRFGREHPIAIGRELTKKFETFVRGSVGEIREEYEKNPPKGEFVVMF